MPPVYKRLLLRAVPKQSVLKRNEAGEVYADENESIFETTDRRAIVLAIRGKGDFEPEELSKIVKMAHETTGHDVVGIFLGNDHDLEVYEIAEEMPDDTDILKES